MLKQLLPATLLTLVLTVLLGLGYPLFMTQLAGRLFPAQAHGSLVEKNGTVLGSALIGQNFTKPDYFHPRLSATTAPDPNDSTKSVPAPYNAANSGASNAAVTSKAQVDAIAAQQQALRDENPQSAKMPIPTELLTASASGLDPDISPEGARFQAARIAAARHAPVGDILALIDAHVQDRLFGLFGAPHVNVLMMNLELDERWPKR